MSIWRSPDAYFVSDRWPQFSSTAGAVIGGAAAAALGSVVSQGFGVATGLQDKFSFKQVALAGISGAIGGGLGEIAKVGKLGTAIQNIGKGLGKAANLVGDVARGAISSALSQGVSVATGLQKSFSWTNVATAGIGSGIAGAASRGLADLGVTGFGNDVGSTMADTIRGAPDNGFSRLSRRMAETSFASIRGRPPRDLLLCRQYSFQS